MSIESSVKDMFSSRRVRGAARDVFGYSLLPCSHMHRGVWEISPQQTLVAHYVADKVELRVYDGPAGVVEHCRR